MYLPLWVCQPAESMWTPCAQYRLRLRYRAQDIDISALSCAHMPGYNSIVNSNRIIRGIHTRSHHRQGSTFVIIVDDDNTAGKQKDYTLERSREDHSLCVIIDLITTMILNRSREISGKNKSKKKKERKKRFWGGTFIYVFVPLVQQVRHDGRLVICALSD